MGAHNLRIQTERYKTGNERLKPDERICEYCTLNKCEDEEHFITVCPNYSNLRSDFFDLVSEKNTFFKAYDDHEKFIWLMTNEDNYILSKLAKFISQCFRIRSKTKTT